MQESTYYDIFDICVHIFGYDIFIHIPVVGHRSLFTASAFELPQRRVFNGFLERSNRCVWVSS